MVSVWFILLLAMSFNQIPKFFSSTAMEILSEFSGDGMLPLESLKVWWTENLKETKMPGNQARAKLKKLHFPNSFPNRQVFHAYVQPSVDRSDEKFSWGESCYSPRVHLRTQPRSSSVPEVKGAPGSLGVSWHLVKVVLFS